MSLYEFTFIAQPNLLQHEVEEMIHELSLLLSNIKADFISREVEDLIGAKPKENQETSAETIKKYLAICSDFLESLMRILWVELEEDFSNLKEIKSKVDTEFKTQLSNIEMKQNLMDYPKDRTKSTFICNIVNAYKKNISQHLIKPLLEVLKSSKIIDSNQLNEILESLLRNIQASGLIKYEYWGLLDFAYPINKVKSGHYCMMCMSFTSGIMDEFQRRIKLNENIIRCLSVRVNRFFKGKSYMMGKQIEDKSA